MPFIETETQKGGVDLGTKLSFLWGMLSLRHSKRVKYSGMEKSSLGKASAFE